tara:strand:+ start:960 stop:1313 length:354 start_codon:yes stop_codon:yes gene_type:complete
MSLGANLKRLRQDKGWTQGDLSKASGVKLGHVSRIERDDTDPKLSTIYKLIECLECSPDALLMDKERVGMSAQLKATFERAEKLADGEKATIIDLIDKYCVASGVQGLLEKKKILAI